MSVFRKYRGKRITSKDKNWSKGVWYVYKRLGEGRVIHRSIKGATTKQQAEEAERKLIEQAFNQRYGIADNTTTFKEFAEGVYTQYVEQRNINKTAKRQYIRLLCDVFKSQPLAGITPQDCRNCQDRMARKGYSASSVNLIMSTASKIFTLACQENILDRNPMQYVSRLKEPPPRDRLLTKEEKERLWKELEKDELLFRLVTVAVNVPLRRGQLLAITPDAIDLPQGCLFVTASKGRATRAVPLNSSASRTFRQMINDCQLPFPLKETGIRKRWNKVLKRAEIENFRFHDLRKEFASELIRQNVNPNIVQKLFAHSDMRITNVYMHSEMAELKAAVNTLDATELQASEKEEGFVN